MSVLIVEDDARLSEFLGIVVRRCGLTSHAVTSGEAALSSIRTGKYSAVILDLILPGMTGFEILQSLRATHPHLLRRIIILTAVSQTTLDRQLDSMSLTWQLIRKPFDVQELATAIEECARFHSTLWPNRKEIASWLAQRAGEGGAKAGLIAVIDGGELRVHASHGFPQGLLKKHFPLPLAAGYPICSAARTGRAVWLASLSADSSYPLLSVWTKSESKAIAAIPLARNGRTVGVAGWSFAEPQRFEDAQRAHFLEAAAECLAMIPLARNGYLQIS